MSDSKEEMPEAPQLERQVSIGSGSAHVVESTVVDTSVEDAWSAISALDFAWWSIIQTGEGAEGASVDCVGGMHTLTFSDGTVWTIEVREISQINRRVVFQVITSEPPLSVSSVVHTLQCHPVTVTNQTFVTWTTDFSIDATGEVLEDSRFKRREALSDLANHFSS